MSPRPCAAGTHKTLPGGAHGPSVSGVRSIPEFLIIALLVTLTPGPATANVLRIAARDGRAMARATILGNSAGVLIWGVLSAAGVSSR